MALPRAPHSNPKKRLPPAGDLERALPERRRAPRLTCLSRAVIVATFASRLSRRPRPRRAAGTMPPSARSMISLEDAMTAHYVEVETACRRAGDREISLTDPFTCH